VPKSKQLKPLLHKRSRARLWVKRIRRESEAFVAFHGGLVAGEHFEGDFAGGSGAGFMFHGLHELLRDTLATPIAVDDDIVDVDEGRGFEGAVAFEAIDKTCGLFTMLTLRGLRPSDEAERERAYGQIVAQARERFGCERRAAAHRVLRVVIEQGGKRSAVLWALVIHAPRDELRGHQA
jgi:hypothetical protein